MDQDCNLNNFEHFPVIIAEQVASGLSYLHNQNVCHRDLKPSYVLVSNSHYSNEEDPDLMFRFWKQSPIICKVTDFGVSRGINLKMKPNTGFQFTATKSLKHGTRFCMAPELLLRMLKLESTTNEDFIEGDMWSYGMIVFRLLNPDIEYPYGIEINTCKGQSFMKVT